MSAIGALFARERGTEKQYSDDQIRFMALHMGEYDAVETWRLVLGDMYCRAETPAGHHATLHVEELAELMNDGLMEMVGDYGADLTDQGRALCQ